MQIRIDYTFSRYDEPPRGDWFINHHAPDLKSKQDVMDYLRAHFEKWTGKGTIVITSISDSFINHSLDEISDSIEGQVIEFDQGKAVFKRGKLSAS